MAHGIERLEIEGDAREEIRAELERIEGHEATPPAPTTDADVDAHAKDYAKRTGLPAGWENAPLSAQIAFLCTDTPEEFDALKAYLKGE